MDKSSDAKRADEMMKEAEKKIKGGFFKNLTTSKAERIDEGTEMIK